MGNSQPRYFSEKESRDIIGYATSERLTAQLKTFCDYGHYVDYDIFSSVLSTYFESMPPKLFEYLFAAFANDIQSKIEIKDFISALAAILNSSGDTTHQRRFLFRVYDIEGRGELDKLRVERVVMTAHSETLNKPAAIAELKALFTHSSHPRYITQKEFESYSGPLDILSGWVRAVLTIFTEPSSTKLSSLERRYSVALEAEQMMDRFGVDRETCDQLRRLFYRHCEADMALSSAVGGVQDGVEGKAELTEASWVRWTAGFVDPELAEVLFRAKLTGLKHVWRFPDFAEFCMIFGRSHSDETKAAFLCVLFQQYALNFEQRETDSQGNSHIGVVTSESDGRESNQGHTEPAGGCEDSNMELERDERDSYSHQADSLQLMTIMRRLMHLLSLPVNTAAVPGQTPSSTVPSSRPYPLPPMEPGVDACLKQLEDSFQQSSNNAATDDSGDGGRDSVEKRGSWRPGGGGATLQAYVTFICDNAHSLPGIQLLSMSACCLFGLRPPSPQLEKVYITELMLWGQAVTLQDSEQPHGPEGAEWALISTAWWDSWRYYVGRASSSSQVQQPPPGEVSNYSLLKKSSNVAQLLPGLQLKRDFEAVPVQVFTALQSWYGGGPPIFRQVVTQLEHAGGVPREHLGKHMSVNLGSREGVPQRPLLELFPLCLRVYTCDRQGRPRESYPREMLCSAVSTVANLLARLQGGGEFDPSKARLWSSFHPPPSRGGSSSSSGIGADSDWRKQRVLIPELTLQAAGLRHEDSLLLEVSLGDGSWPKSKLHAQLEAEEVRKASNSSGQAELPLSPLSPLHADGVVVLNDGGKVGLDNLGNTCYLNSSLQALLHTPHLVEYFLRKTHLREVNQHSKFGFKGRLAFAFGKLASDLWVPRGEHQREKEGRSSLGSAASSALSTLKSIGVSAGGGGHGGSSVSPHKFRKELMALHEQFDNNEQHDAQELLTFLLDGLSEDLNLVHDKPYVEQPDSDDHTADKELAATWWENHLKREHSVMQALFTGQFKSITRCVQEDCTYHSARFEPFNMLSLPLPDNEQRVVLVYLVTRASRRPVRCAVLVQKSSGTVGDIEDALHAYKDIPGLEQDNVLEDKETSGLESQEGENPHRFIACKLFRGKLAYVVDRSTSVDTIKESDDLFFYQVLLEQDVLQIGQPATATDLSIPNPSETSLSHSSFKRPLHSPPSPSTAALCTSNKRADTRSERDPSTAATSSLSSSLPLTARNETQTKTETNPEIEEDVTGPSKMETVEEDEDRVKLTTVVLVHRRVHSSSRSPHQHNLGQSQGGLKLFRMRAVGLPLLESLPSRIHPRALYEAVERRVRGCFKTSILDLQRRNNSGIPDHNSHHYNSDLSTASSAHKIRPIATEDAVGGDIPPFGFVLRLVKLNADCCSRCHWLNRCEGCLIPYTTGSSGSDVSDGEMIELTDLQSIAIDWHYIVYHEALEVFPSADSARLPLVAIPHSSVSMHAQQQSQALPLQKCLQKFTEEEALDDMVCPTCKHSDGCLRRSFALWRLPPVLIIQLKRFQFNAYSRRKLTNQVDFPFEGLDLSCYLAPSHELSQQYQLYQQQLQQEKTENEEEKDLEGKVHINSGAVTVPLSVPVPPNSTGSDSSEDSCSALYDLYSTVHHVGALGGGHYVASVRDDFGPLQARLLHRSSPSSSSVLTQNSESDSELKERRKRPETMDELSDTDPLASPQGENEVCSVGGEDKEQLVAGSEGESGLGSEWYCYNDSVVSPTTPREIAAGSSAYLLFYMRRDVRAASVTAFHTHTVDSESENGSDSEKDAPHVNSSCEGKSDEGRRSLSDTRYRAPGTDSRDRARTLPGSSSASSASPTRFDVNVRDVDELTESDNGQCRVS